MPKLEHKQKGNSIFEKFEPTDVFKNSVLSSPFVIPLFCYPNHLKAKKNKSNIALMGRKSTKNGNQGSDKKTKTLEQPKLLLCKLAEKIVQLLRMTI